MNTNMEMVTSESVKKHVSALAYFFRVSADYDQTTTDLLIAQENQESEENLYALHFQREAQQYDVELASRELQKTVAELVITNTKYTLVKKS